MKFQNVPLLLLDVSSAKHGSMTLGGWHEEDDGARLPVRGLVVTPIARAGMDTRRGAVGSSRCAFSFVRQHLVYRWQL